MIRWLPVLVGLLLIGAFLRLGQWQTDRAAFKDQLFARFDEGRAQEPVRLRRWQALPAYTPAWIAGRLDTETRVYLENRVVGGRDGVHLLVPLRTAEPGPEVLVNLGWQPLGSRRELPPFPRLEDRSGAAGLLVPPPAAGIKLGDLDLARQDSPFRVTWLDVEGLGQRLNSQLAPQILLATPPHPELIRDWRPNTMPAARHRAYAFQWRALAAAVAVLTGWGIWRLLRDVARTRTSPHTESRAK